MNEVEEIFKDVISNLEHVSDSEQADMFRIILENMRIKYTMALDGSNNLELVNMGQRLLLEGIIRDIAAMLHILED